MRPALPAGTGWCAMGPGSRRSMGPGGHRLASHPGSPHGQSPLSILLSGAASAPERGAVGRSQTHSFLASTSLARNSEEAIWGRVALGLKCCTT